jgi:hypothetical protein
MYVLRHRGWSLGSREMSSLEKQVGLSWPSRPDFSFPGPTHTAMESA